MRITREFIQKYTRQVIERRTHADKEILGVLLCGSFLDENFLLGGAGDVDLFFIHSGPPLVEREIVRLTDEVHLDIAHRDQKEYRETRSLRVHPWLGPMLNSCKILFDPQHFLDFIQASVRGQYDRPEYIYQRARPLANKAREIWFELQINGIDDDLKAIAHYLMAVGKSVNAIASLAGTPLPERRLLLEFRARAEALEHPGLYQGLLGLLGAPNCTTATLQDSLRDWAEAFKAIPPKDRTGRFNPARFQYYMAVYKEILESDQPVLLLWLLLTTWTDIVSYFPPGSIYRTGWQSTLDNLGIYGPGLGERIQALDAFLDTVEEILEKWAEANGVWELT